MPRDPRAWRRSALLSNTSRSWPSTLRMRARSSPSGTSSLTHTARLTTRRSGVCWNGECRSSLPRSVAFYRRASTLNGEVRARQQFRSTFEPVGRQLAGWVRLGSRLDVAPGRYQLCLAAVGANGSSGSVFTEVTVPKFTDDLALPADLDPGRYRLTVDVGSGDDRARRELVFTLVEPPP